MIQFVSRYGEDRRSFRTARQWPVLGMLTAAVACSGTATVDSHGDAGSGQGIAYTAERADRTEPFPAGTIVARFDLPVDSLHSVRSSRDLVDALQQHLTLDLAMPLEEPLQIHMRGMVGAYDSGMPYHFTLSPIGVGYRGSTPLDRYSYADAVRESHGDDFPPDDDDWEEFGSDEWDAAGAWALLTKALDVGLPQASSDFAPLAEGGHVPLRVTGVHIREFTMPDLDTGWLDYGDCCTGEFDGAVLEIRPDVTYQSLLTGAGADVAQNLTVLVIELGQVER